MGSFFVITGAIGFLRMKDLFIKLHAINIANCYGITFILIGIGIRYYFEISLIKLSIAIIINLLVNITCLHTIGRRAYIDNVDAKFKKRNNQNKKEIKDEEDE
jgi:multicomponent Na+:H+ antiporter subunit G